MKATKINNPYNHKDIEIKWIDKLSLSNDYNNTRNTFSLAIPPPNVTGNLHLGHALNSTIQDVLVKFHILKGDNVKWTPGTDHAGIATQLLVEKSLINKGKDPKSLSTDNLIDEIWKWKNENGDQIITQLKSLGLSCDWEDKKFTLDKDMSYAVNQAFIQLFNEGLIYKEKTLVNWDPVLQTAISDLEVVSEEKKGLLYSFKYYIVDSDEYIIVSTTRPETAFGDTAVAVNPEDERYQRFIGKKVKNIFNNKEIPIISDAYADKDKGSGAVKITPGHDFNDFDVAKRNNLPMINILNEDGTLNESVHKDFVGLNVLEAREKILEFMKEEGIYIGEEEVLNAIPKGDRSSAIIEPLLKDQWFLDVKDMAEKSIGAVKSGEINFTPKFWENTFFEWMNKIKPWCISRQILWGHKIPVWTCSENKSVAAQTEAEALEVYKKQFNKTPKEFQQENDVLDTWFSSALWPFSTLGWPKNSSKLNNYFPTTILVTGFDIIFFWVARMIMMSLKLTNQVPFKTVYIHNLIRDQKGDKMSKTKGNVIDPLDLIKDYGTDSLRFFLMSNLSPHSDIKIAKNSLDPYKNFMNKIWNAYKYVKANSEGFRIVAKLNPNSFYDFWIINKFSKLLENYTYFIENCEIEKSSSEIYKFFWDDFCDWFIEISKISLSEESNDSTKEILLNIFNDFCLILYPFCPFISLDLLNNMNPNNLHMKIPDKNKYNFENPESDNFVIIQDFIVKVRSLRKNLSIPPTEKIKVYIDKSNIHYEFLNKNFNIVSKLANVESLIEETGNEKNIITTVSKFFRISFVRDEKMDIQMQKSKLLKDLDSINKDLNRVESKLKNKKFLDSAPRDVIDRENRILKESKLIKENIESILRQLI